MRGGLTCGRFGLSYTGAQPLSGPAASAVKTIDPRDDVCLWLWSLAIGALIAALERAVIARKAELNRVKGIAIPNRSRALHRQALGCKAAA